MKKEEQKALLIAATVNELKKTMKDFTAKQFIAALKENKCPYYQWISGCLLKQGLISRKNGVYNFTDNKPIYFGMITSTVKHAVEVLSKPKVLKGHDETQVVEKLMTFEDFIQEVKLRGGKIMMPKPVEYEEI